MRNKENPFIVKEKRENPKIEEENIKILISVVNIMEFIKPFLIGGCVIAGSKVVAKYSSPALAPLVGGMPTGIIASFFMSKQEDKRKYFDGYFYSSILLAISIVCIDLIAGGNKKMNVDLISVIGLIIWAILSYFAINHFVNKKK